MGQRHIFLDLWKKDDRLAPFFCLFVFSNLPFCLIWEAYDKAVGFQLRLAVGDKKQTEKGCFTTAVGVTLLFSAATARTYWRLLWTTSTIDLSLTITSNFLFHFCQGRRRSHLIWILELNIKNGPFALHVLTFVFKQVWAQSFILRQVTPDV